MNFIEQRGEVVFQADSKGNLFQKIGDGEPFKVRDGRISYKRIKTVSGLDIKYNTNGVYGFSIWRGKTNLEDNFWTLADAERMAQNIGG